jgi:hypothetical protein
MSEPTLSPAESDAAEAFESKDTSRALPLGWLALFFGLIAWGAFYLWAYTPSLGGWSQEGAYQQSIEKK